MRETPCRARSHEMQVLSRGLLMHAARVIEVVLLDLQLKPHIAAPAFIETSVMFRSRVSRFREKKEFRDSAWYTKCSVADDATPQHESRAGM